MGCQRTDQELVALPFGDAGAVLLARGTVASNIVASRKMVRQQMAASDLSEGRMSLAISGIFLAISLTRHDRTRLAVRRPQLSKLFISLVRNKVQLDFGCGRMICGDVFPLLNRHDSRIYQNRVASDGRDFSDGTVSTNGNGEANDAAYFVLFQFARVFWGHLVDQTA